MPKFGNIVKDKNKKQKTNKTDTSSVVAVPLARGDFGQRTKKNYISGPQTSMRVCARVCAMPVF